MTSNTDSSQIMIEQNISEKLFSKKKIVWKKSLKKILIEKKI